MTCGKMVMRWLKLTLHSVQHAACRGSKLWLPQLCSLLGKVKDHSRQAADWHCPAPSREWERWAGGPAAGGLTKSFFRRIPAQNQHTAPQEQHPVLQPRRQHSRPIHRWRLGQGLEHLEVEMPTGKKCR
jgi:hypothetical protein